MMRPGRACLRWCNPVRPAASRYLVQQRPEHERPDQDQDRQTQEHQAEHARAVIVIVHRFPP